jgi:hypothetical protein
MQEGGNRTFGIIITFSKALGKEGEARVFYYIFFLLSSCSCSFFFYIMLFF